jgi:multidrug transporter EmrE-like cation transporter
LGELMNTALAAIGCVLLSVSAQFLIKAGMASVPVKAALAGPVGLQAAAAVILSPKVVVGLALYTLGAIVWLGVLARWDVSKAYPLEGLGFALAVVFGFLIGEQVTVMRALGVLMICAGVFVVSAS